MTRVHVLSPKTNRKFPLFTFILSSMDWDPTPTKHSTKSRANWALKNVMAASFWNINFTDVKDGSFVVFGHHTCFFFKMKPFCSALLWLKYYSIIWRYYSISFKIKFVSIHNRCLILLTVTPGLLPVRKKTVAEIQRGLLLLNLSGTFIPRQTTPYEVKCQDWYYNPQSRALFPQPKSNRTGIKLINFIYLWLGLAQTR